MRRMRAKATEGVTPTDCEGVTSEGVTVTPLVTLRETGNPVDNICAEVVITKPTFTDLPLDVQHQIEKHCAENNKGERAGSHSRAAMTERALHYQEVCGKGVVV